MPKHILITGASGGLGAALAITYAAPGVRLSLHGRDAERLHRVAEKVTAKGATVHIKIGNVTDSAVMAAWITACDQFMPLDLLIANAGISAGTGRGHETPEQSSSIFDVNLKGVLNSIQPVLPLMLQRRAGHIAIMSSLAGFRGLSGAASYCASKAAVRIYGESLRSSCAAKDVAVSVICPGFIKTPMTDSNRFPMPFLMSAERAARIIKRGLDANKPRIAFPWQLYGLLRLYTALPQRWLDIIAAKLPQKGG